MIRGHGNGHAGGEGVLLGWGDGAVGEVERFVGTRSRGAPCGADRVAESLLHDGAEERELLKGGEGYDGMWVGDVGGQFVAETA